MRRLLALGMIATLAACGSDSTPPVAPVTVASVDVSAPSTSLAIGATTQLAATPKTSAGAAVSGRTITYSSATQSVATVSTTGMVTAVAAGTSLITASADGKNGTITITVTAPAPVATVALSAASSSLNIGADLTTVVVLKDAGNNVLTGRTVTYSSSATSVATVNATTGVVRGVAAGTVVITATSETRTGTLSLTVNPAPVIAVNTVELSPLAPSILVGATQQFTVVLKDGAGAVLPNAGRTITFTSSATAVATITGTGSATAVAAGTTTITASSEGKNATTVLTVTNVPVSTIAIAPLTPSIFTGVTQQFTVVLKDAAGNTLSNTGRVIAYTSSSPAIASIGASTGLASGLAAGTTTITATVEGKTASTVLTVTDAPVATVNLNASAALFSVADTNFVLVTLKDANGNVLTGRVITFSSSDNSIATVDANGRIAAVAVGQATITVTSETKTATIVITVRAKVGSVTLDKSSASPLVGSMISISATVRDDSNNILTDRPVSWSSSNPAVATVDGNGVVTAVAPGTATITARAEGQSATAAITVVQPVNSVTLNATATSIPASGGSFTIAVTLRDINNVVLNNNQHVITFTTSDATIATVNSSTGVVTAVAAGVATITVSSEGKSATLTVTVTP